MAEKTTDSFEIYKEHEFSNKQKIKKIFTSWIKSTLFLEEFLIGLSYILILN